MLFFPSRGPLHPRGLGELREVIVVVVVVVAAAGVGVVVLNMAVVVVVVAVVSMFAFASVEHASHIEAPFSVFKQVRHRHPLCSLCLRRHGWAAAVVPDDPCWPLAAAAR